jgi:hypothetical protein
MGRKTESVQNLFYRPVPFIVCRIMRQCAQREGVLINVLSIPKERSYELSAAHIMGQIAEEVASVRTIAKVLDEGAAMTFGSANCSTFLTKLAFFV